jgi:hypothetical protein
MSEVKNKVSKRKPKTVESQPTAETIPERVLFPHQVETVELMERIEREQCTVCPDTGFLHYCSYGSLCNPIGSGKTSSVLKVIKNDKLRFETVNSLTIHLDGKTLTGDPRPMFFNKNRERGIVNSTASASSNHLNLEMLSNMNEDEQRCALQNALLPRVRAIHPENAVHITNFLIESGEPCDILEALEEDEDLKSTIEEAVTILGDKLKSKNAIVLYPININIVICNKALTVVWKKEAECMGVVNVTIDLPRHVNGISSFLERIAPLLSVENGVLIVSSHLYGNVVTYLKSLIGTDFRIDYRHFISPKRIILDDIHAVQRFSYGVYNISPLFIWSVNSTPGLVRWDYIDRSIGSVILTRPKISGYKNIGHLVQINIPENFYKVPDVIVHRQHYKRNDMGTILKDHIPQYIKDMLETGDFDGAYREMLSEARGISSENEESETIVSTRKPIHELVKIKYMREIEQLNDRKRRLIENGWDVGNIDRSIKEIVTKMEILDQRLVKLNDEVIECPICMDEIERSQMVTTKCCFNSFCKDCIINGCFRTNKTCPLCRKGICQMDIYTFSSDGTAIDLDLKEIARQRSDRLDKLKLPKTPMDALMNLVLSKPQGKFVVFNPNHGSSSTFKTFFRGSGIAIEDLSGSIMSIQRKLTEFEQGKIKILFLNLHSSNAGLNLQFATDVVIIDSATLLDEKNSQYSQSIGRVRRFPRLESIPVHYITPIQ